jgi:hypothetical protein
MSVDLMVYLPRARMPTPARWASAISEAGFEALTLDTEFDVDEHSGFLPCRMDGAESGFEYASGPIESIDGLELPETFDFSVTLATHSDMRELACSVIAAAVLCSITDGVLVDPQADERVEAEDAIRWAREVLAEIDL